MILNSQELADRLEEGARVGATGKDTESGAFIISPTPDLKPLRTRHTASVDLRLGTWFLSLRETRLSEIGATEDGTPWSEGELAKTHYVPFGQHFVLHPGSFVLAATFEWIRLPKNLAAYVVGLSSWGRTGLIIATAVGVHPGFTGCLTLELANAGKIPIRLDPGALICQLFVHTCSTSESVSESQFGGSRRPRLGQVKLDPIARKLARLGTRPSQLRLL